MLYVNKEKKSNHGNVNLHRLREQEISMKQTVDTNDFIGLLLLEHGLKYRGEEEEVHAGRVRPPPPCSRPRDFG